IIDDKDESDEVRKEKGKEFEKHVNTWKDLVLKREEYKHVRHPYQLFKWISMLFALMCGGVFYYLSTIDILTSQEQIGLNIAIILSTLIMIVFSWFIFVLCLYYFTLSLLCFIFFFFFGFCIFLVYFVVLFVCFILFSILILFNYINIMFYFLFFVWSLDFSPLFRCIISKFNHTCLLLDRRSCSN